FFTTCSVVPIWYAISLFRIPRVMHAIIASSLSESLGCVRGFVSDAACALYASITHEIDWLSIHVSPAAILRTHFTSRSGEIDRGTTPRTPRRYSSTVLLSSLSET